MLEFLPGPELGLGHAVVVASFIAECLILGFIFRARSLLSIAKICFVSGITNLIAAIFVFFYTFFWFFMVMRLVPHSEMIFFLTVVSSITFIKGGIIATFLKKPYHQFIGWLFVINSIGVAVGTIGYFVRPIFGPIFLGIILSAQVVAMTCKLSVITVGLRKIMSAKTLLIILLMNIVSVLIKTNIITQVFFVAITQGVALRTMVSLAIFLLEGTVGWLFLRKRMRFTTLLLLLFVANAAYAVMYRISIQTFRVYFLPKDDL